MIFSCFCLKKLCHSICGEAGGKRSVHSTCSCSEIMKSFLVLTFSCVRAFNCFCFLLFARLGLYNFFIKSLQIRFGCKFELLGLFFCKDIRKYEIVFNCFLSANFQSSSSVKSNSRVELKHYILDLWCMFA